MLLFIMILDEAAARQLVLRIGKDEVEAERAEGEREQEAWVIVRLFETCPLDDAEPQHPFTKDSMLERQRPFQKVIAKVRSDIAPPMDAKGFPVGYDLVRASTLKGGIPFECTTQRNSREEGFIHPLMKPC